MRKIMLWATTPALMWAGMAQAQTAPGVQIDMTKMSGDSAERFLDNRTNFDRLSDDVGTSARLLRPVPAKPKDVVPGLEVRDSKGLVIGAVDSVGGGFAVVASDLGRVEVDLASFAKNKNGLLINMPKAKIDKMMSGGK